MDDGSNTHRPTTSFDQDASNRVSALSALYQAEQSTLNSLDSQVLLLVGLLVTYGVATATALGTTPSVVNAAWMDVALPVPAWILLGYNAILWTKVSSHSAAAKIYRTNLTRFAGAQIHDGIPRPDQLNRWGRVVFGIAGSRVLSYGVAFVAIIGFTCVMLRLVWDRPGWFWGGVILYLIGFLIVGAAWLRIFYVQTSADSRFKQGIDRRFQNRRSSSE